MAISSLNDDLRDGVDELALREHKPNTNENKIICLSFATEDGYGDEELLLREQNTPFAIPNNLQSTSPIASLQGANSGQNDIVYFNHDTLEKLELHQTRPLQQAADTKTVAIDWLSLSTDEELKETLMTVYSRLRNIERIIIVVDDSSQCTTTGREVQEMIRNQAFWQECNRQYAHEQILSMKTPKIPQICHMQISTDCEDEKTPRLQLVPLAHDLVPNLDEL